MRDLIQPKVRGDLREEREADWVSWSFLQQTRHVFCITRVTQGERGLSQSHGILGSNLALRLINQPGLIRVTYLGL